MSQRGQTQATTRRKENRVEPSSLLLVPGSYEGGEGLVKREVGQRDDVASDENSGIKSLGG